METLANLPLLHCDSQRAWEDWLAAHHTEPQGVWLKLAKKGTGVASVSQAEAVEAALCYGWIDGQAKAYDDTFWLQRFTPRRARSIWSRVNTEKAAQLIASGRMTPAGQRQVDAAKQDGRWEAAYQPQAALTIPDDFRVALDEHPQAQAFFATLNKVNRYSICHRIEIARRPETRAARIEKFIAMLAANEKLHP